MHVNVSDAKALDQLYQRISEAMTHAQTMNMTAVASLGQTASEALEVLTLLAPLVQQAATFTNLIAQAQDELTRQRAAQVAEQAEHQQAVQDMERQALNARDDRDLLERQILDLREKQAAEEMAYQAWKDARHAELETLRVSLGR